MDKEKNSLTLLTMANLYPRVVRAVLGVGGMLLVLGPTLDTEGWGYLTSTPSVMLGLVLGFLGLLLTGMKPGDSG